MRIPEGFFSVVGVTDKAGRPVDLDEVVRRGWVIPGPSAPAGVEGIPLGHNLFVDNGRQYLAYAAGFRSPIQNYTIQRFGVGTGTSPTSASDSGLENPVLLQGGVATRQVDFVDFPAPFSIRVVFTLGLGDCNGYALSEFGIFSGDQTMMARFVRPAINKSSDFAPKIAYCMRT